LVVPDAACWRQDTQAVYPGGIDPAWSALHGVCSTMWAWR